MLRKLNLNATDAYELAIITLEATKMLSEFILGEGGIINLGMEQGDIETWDDIVIEENGAMVRHVQVKRQTTNFCDKPVTRSTITQGKNKGQLHGRSPLDESMKAFGEWSLVNPTTSGSSSKKFELQIADSGVLIKEGINVADFSRLCNQHITQVSTVEKFDALVASDRKSGDIVTWLKSWCDFQDSSHILQTLKLLEVTSLGTQDEVLQRASDTLKTQFSNPEEAVRTIKSFIYDNRSPTTTITARDLYAQVAHLLHPNVRNWTQYHFKDNDCHISGTHDMVTGNVEYAGEVVSKLWKDSHDGMLKMDSAVDMRLNLSQAIVRLALHLQSSTAQFTNSPAWIEGMKGATGGTLGKEENDITGLRIIEGLACGRPINTRPLQSVTDFESEAGVLSNQMNAETWALVCQEVNRKILALHTGTLQPQMDKRWRNWVTKLDGDIAEQAKLCTSMLHPAAEGGRIVAELRVGPKTISLISKGIFTLLIVSVCLNGFDDNWSAVGDELSVITKANRYWSGPSDDDGVPRALAKRGREKLLAAEQTKVLILSEVEASPTDFLNRPLAYTSAQQDSLAAKREPKTITFCTSLSDRIDKGDLEAVRDYLKTLLN